MEQEQYFITYMLLNLAHPDPRPVPESWLSEDGGDWSVLASWDFPSYESVTGAYGNEAGAVLLNAFSFSRHRSHFFSICLRLSECVCVCVCVCECVCVCVCGFDLHELI